MTMRSTTCLVVAGLLVCRSAPMLSAAEPKRLRVTGTGRVELRPDVMELAASVTGSAELTSDTLKKFRENRRRGIAAINKLKIQGLEVKGSGMSVVSNAMMQQFQQMWGGGQPQVSPGQTTFTETLFVQVPGIDHLPEDQVQDLATKILDAAKDAGLTMGRSMDRYRNYYDYNNMRPQIVSFRAQNAEMARQKALDMAAEDARKKAEQMSKRLGLGIGKVLSVQDASAREIAPNSPYSEPRAAKPAAAEVASLHDIEVDAVLTVEYEIVN